MAGEFIYDVEQIRARARRHMSEGARTEAYEGDVKHTIELLNAALATEIVCVLRYRHHYYMASGLDREAAVREFDEHAANEQQHADRLARRIQQLGGAPDLNPANLLTRSISVYAAGSSLAEMILEDLVAERAVIEIYSEMIRHFAFHDPSTRSLLEDLLRDEEEHANDMAELLSLVNPTTGETKGEDPLAKAS